MIRITRPAAVPATLAGRGASETRENGKSYDDAPEEYSSGQKKFNIRSSIYSHNTVRTHLWQLITRSAATARRYFVRATAEPLSTFVQREQQGKHAGSRGYARATIGWLTCSKGAAFVFVAVDHCTTECIGLHAAKRGTRFEALEPIRQGVRERFGEIGDGVARGLRLRHDHGSNYLADDFQQEVAFFGIESSPSFVREPEGNGVAERFIRTLKENLLWVRSFDTIEELRLALLAFKRTYNEQWMGQPALRVRRMQHGEVRPLSPRERQ